MQNSTFLSLIIKKDPKELLAVLESCYVEDDPNSILPQFRLEQKKKKGYLYVLKQYVEGHGKMELFINAIRKQKLRKIDAS
jgi:hypothetical protein